jgi:hypothetical protein
MFVQSFQSNFIRLVQEHSWALHSLLLQSWTGERQAFFIGWSATQCELSPSRCHNKFQLNKAKRLNGLRQRQLIPDGGFPYKCWQCRNFTSAVLLEYTLSIITLEQKGRHPKRTHSLCDNRDKVMVLAAEWYCLGCFRIFYYVSVDSTARLYYQVNKRSGTSWLKEQGWYYGIFDMDDSGQNDSQVASRSGQFLALLWNWLFVS